MTEQNPIILHALYLAIIGIIYSYSNTPHPGIRLYFLILNPFYCHIAIHQGKKLLTILIMHRIQSCILVTFGGQSVIKINRVQSIDCIIIIAIKSHIQNPRLTMTVGKNSISFQLFKVIINSNRFVQQI